MKCALPSLLFWLVMTLVIPTLLFADTASSYQYDTFWCKYFNVIIKPFGGCEITPSVSTTVPVTPSVFPIPVIIESRPVVAVTKPDTETSVSNTYPTTIIRETVPEFLIQQLIKAELKKTSLLTSNNNIDLNVDSASGDELKALALLLKKQSESDADRVGDISRDIRNEIDAIISGDTSLELLTVTGTTTLEGNLAISGGAITLANFVPSVTADTLYNSAGSLYWNGSLLAGAAVGNWDSNGSDVYRLTGNVGIGTTTPSHSFTVTGDINATGALRFNGNPGTAGMVLLSNGSIAPTWTATSSLGLGSNWSKYSGGGIYYASGNVGIGTTMDNPSALLEVYSGNTNTYIQVGTDGTGQGENNGIKFGYDDSGYGYIDNSNENTPFNIINGGSARLSVLSNGNVGFGTTTPGYKLDVQSTTDTNAIIARFGNGDGNANSAMITDKGRLGLGMGASIPTAMLDIRGIDWSNGFAAVDPLILRDNSSAVLFIVQSNGSVGISSTTPAAKFSVTGSGTGTGLLAQFADSANTPRMTILDNGNVGIGTTLPTEKLSVSGNILLNPNGSTARNISWGTGFDSAALTLYDGGAGVRYGWGLRANEMQFFIPNGAARHFSWNKGGDLQAIGTNELMRLTEAGSLGIGTTTPSAKLSVTGSGTGTGLLAQFADSANTPRMTILDNGRVGLGTTTPAGMIHLDGTDVGYGIRFTRVGLSAFIVGSTNHFYLGTESSDPVTLRTLGFDRLTILPTGEVGIGTTTPSAKLSITGTAGTDDIFAIASSTNARLLTVTSSGNIGIGTTTPNGLLHLYKNNPVSNEILFRVGTSDNSSRFTIDEDGDVGISGTIGWPNDEYFSRMSDGISVTAGLLNVASFFGGTNPALSPGHLGVFQQNDTLPALGVKAHSTATSSLFQLNNSSNVGLSAFDYLGRLGIGTTTPQAQLHTLSTTEQLRLGYDASNYTSLTVSSGGDLTINSSGGNTYLSDTVRVDGVCVTGATVACWQNAGGIAQLTDTAGGHIMAVTNQASLWFQSGTSLNWTNSSGLSVTGDTSISRISAGVVGVGTGTQGSVAGTLVAGSIGIGSTTPAAKLSVTGSGTGTGLLAQFADSANTPRMTILDNGNVGIGTTTPLRVLSVNGSVENGTLAEFQSLITNDGNYFDVGFRVNSSVWGNRNRAALRTYLSGNGGALGLLTTNNISGALVERVRITRDGYVGIGTDTPGYLLTVAGDINATGSLRFNGNAGTAGMVLLSNGSSAPTWTATSSLGLALSGGINGHLSRWTSASSIGTGILLDNGTVAGVNATNSTTTLLVQGNTGSANAFTVASSTGLSMFTVNANGNIGIGNIAATTTGEKLYVAGNIRALSDSNNYVSVTPQYIQFFSGGASTLEIHDDGWINFEASNGKALNLQSNGSDIMFQGGNSMIIKNGGNIGIGTPTPNDKLGVYNGNVSIAGEGQDFSLKFESDGLADGTPAYLWSKNNVGFAVGGSTSTPQFVVNTSSGNIGIGTTSTPYKLTVDGSIAPSISNAYYLGDSNRLFSTGYISNIYSGYVAGPTTAMFLANNDNNDSYINVQEAEMNLYSPQFDFMGGNVGIGTSTPVNLLDVYGNTNSQSMVRVTSGSAGDNASASFTLENNTGNSGRLFKVGSGHSGYKTILANDLGFFNSANAGNISILNDYASGEIQFTAGGASTAQMTLKSTGYLGIGTTTPGSQLTVDGTIMASNLFGGATNLTVDANGNIIRDPSDVRLKTNITEIQNALDTVLALRGVRYEWRDKERFGDQVEIGFLAQEVDLLVPEVVSKGGDYWSLNTKNLVAVVVEAIQELYDRLEENFAIDADQSAEIEALRARIEQLEAEKNVSASEAQTDVVETGVGGGAPDGATDSNPEVSETGVGEGEIQVDVVTENVAETVAPAVEIEEVVPEVPVEAGEAAS